MPIQPQVIRVSDPNQLDDHGAAASHVVDKEDYHLILVFK